MYSLLDDMNSRVRCPYNKSHLISSSCIQKHIVKCEKNSPPNLKLMCPYDATHRLFKSEMIDHVITCPARRVLEPRIYQVAGSNGIINTGLNADITTTIDYTENWDKEDEVDNDTVFTNDDSCLESTCDDSKNAAEPSMQIQKSEKPELRPPRGFSEAAMTNETTEVCFEDTESVISGMGFGRGKFSSRNEHLLKAIGLGRGKPI